MNFNEWILETFGPRGRVKAARFLGVPYKTVMSWCYLARFPMPRQQQLIRIKSKGQVNINLWQQQYLDAKDNNGVDA